MYFPYQKLSDCQKLTIRVDFQGPGCAFNEVAKLDGQGT